METLTAVDEQKDIVTLEGTTIRATCFYDWPERHSETYVLELCEFDDPLCRYWSAHLGVCRAFKVIEGQTAICTVEKLLYALFPSTSDRGWLDTHYIIWKPKSCSPLVIKRWITKWTFRTRA